MEIKPNNFLAQVHADGSATLKADDSCTFTLDGKGNAIAQIPYDVSVGIKNISEVESHTITTVFGSRSHVVRFSNGGLSEYAYNNANQLIDLNSSNLTSSLDLNNDLLFFIEPHHPLRGK